MLDVFPRIGNVGVGLTRSMCSAMFACCIKEAVKIRRARGRMTGSLQRHRDSSYGTVPSSLPFRFLRERNKHMPPKSELHIRTSDLPFLGAELCPADVVVALPSRNGGNHCLSCFAKDEASRHHCQRRGIHFAHPYWVCNAAATML